MTDEITYCPETGRRQRSFTIDLTQDQEAIDKEIDEMATRIKEVEETQGFMDDPELHEAVLVARKKARETLKGTDDDV